MGERHTIWRSTSSTYTRLRFAPSAASIRMAAVAAWATACSSMIRSSALATFAADASCRSAIRPAAIRTVASPCCSACARMPFAELQRPAAVVPPIAAVSSAVTPIAARAPSLAGVGGRRCSAPCFSRLVILVSDLPTTFQRLRWLNIADSVKETESYRFQASTSADGAYRLAGLVPGPYEVTFELGGFRSQRVSVLLRADSPLVQDVVLEPLVPASLAGQVVDQQGLALPGADVTGTSSGAPVQRAVTDQAGGFRFPDLRPGVWEVLAQLPGFEAGSAVADVVFGEPAAVQVALTLGYSLAEEVVVVGSRRATAQRTVSESVVPVDVLGAEDVRSQPHADMAHLLRALAPSFNVNTQPISDAATVVRPVNLRNLAPDHLLVLVNGKRRHRAAVIAWLGNGISDGSQGSPNTGVRRLRCGAGRVRPMT